MMTFFELERREVDAYEEVHKPEQPTTLGGWILHFIFS